MALQAKAVVWFVMFYRKRSGYPLVRQCRRQLCGISPRIIHGDAVYNSFGDGYSPRRLAANTDRTKKDKTLLATEM